MEAHLKALELAGRSNGQPLALLWTDVDDVKLITPGSMCSRELAKRPRLITWSIPSRSVIARRAITSQAIAINRDQRIAVTVQRRRRDPRRPAAGMPAAVAARQRGSAMAPDGGPQSRVMVGR